MNSLRITIDMSIRDANDGLFISRGVSRQPERVLPFFDLIYVRTGALHIREDDVDYLVTAGQTLLLFPDRRHQGTKDYEDDLSFYWIHFDVIGNGETDSEPTPCPSVKGRVIAGLDVPQYATAYRPDRLTEAFRRYLDDHQSGMRTQLPADLTMLQILSEVSMSGRAPQPPIMGES